MKYVVFDLGGVLIDWNPRHLYRKLLSDEDMEKFLSEVATGPWNEQMDEGKPFEEGIRELSLRFPNQAKLIRLYFERWPEMLRGDIPGTVAILEDLHRQRFPLYALTNWSSETFAFAKERFDFLQRFRGIVVSGVERVKKPDPRIFEILLSRYELDPADGIYIDDVEKNVHAAKTLGLDGILFEGPEALTIELERRGLPVRRL
ncbi:MAG: HAD family phosphatase [Myxococcales bacterium]|nr:HAD family phosphatase [Myxococcales bacterium]